MFKVIGKILAILLVAGLVCGALYLVVNHTGAFSGISRGGFDGGFEGGRSQLRAAPNGSFTPPQGLGDGGFRGDHEGRDGASLARGLPGVLVNGAKIALITVLVALAQWVGSRIKTRRKQPQAAA